MAPNWCGNCIGYWEPLKAKGNTILEEDEGGLERGEG